MGRTAVKSVILFFCSQLKKLMTARRYAMRVFWLRMVEVKKSQKRSVPRGPELETMTGNWLGREELSLPEAGTRANCGVSPFTSLV